VKLRTVKTIQDCQKIASDSEALESVETVVRTWCAQIEQVFMTIVFLRLHTFYSHVIL